MPVPRHQLNFLIEMLKGDILEPSQAAAQFLDFQGQQQAQRAARQEALMGGGEHPGLDALRDVTMAATTGEEPISLAALTNRLQGTASMYGLNGIPPAIAQGATAMYGGQMVDVDEDDTNEIAKRVLLGKQSGRGLHDIRMDIVNEYVQALGSPELYDQIRLKVRDIIDRSWAGEIVPEF